MASVEREREKSRGRRPNMLTPPSSCRTNRYRLFPGPMTECAHASHYRRLYPYPIQPDSLATYHYLDADTYSLYALPL
jgi:hypothetical protein